MNKRFDEAVKKEEVARKVVGEFYRLNSVGDRIRMYECMDTEFKKAVSLLSFMRHSAYDLDIGRLTGIKAIDLQGDRCFADCSVEQAGCIREASIALRWEHGEWKIIGKSIYKRR